MQSNSDDPSIWAALRIWRHAAAPTIAVLLLVMRYIPPDSPLSIACVVFGGMLALTYVIEEVAWSVKCKGRPCPHCGHLLKMKSFRIYTCCPNCNEELSEW